MDPLTLGVVGLAVLALLPRKQRGAVAPPQTSTPAARPVPPVREQGIGDLAKTLGTINPLAAAGTIAAAVGGDIARKLTGDTRTGSVGVALDLMNGKPVDLGELGKNFSIPVFAAETGGTFGIAGAAGEAAGHELGQQLGAGDDPLADVMLRSLGFEWGLWSSVDPLGGLGILSIAAPIYALYSGLSDANRLAYGQPGALNDYWKDWAKQRENIRKLLGHHFPTATQDELERLSQPAADGFMRQQNALAFREWMTRGRGLFGLGNITDQQHAEYGRDRGYFIGTRAIATGELIEAPAPKSWEQPYGELAQRLPMGALRKVQFEQLHGWRWKLVPKMGQPSFSTFGRPPAWAGPLEQSESAFKAERPSWQFDLQPFKARPPVLFTNPNNPRETVTVSNFWEPTWLQVTAIHERTVNDDLVDVMMRFGEQLANVAAFGRWMRERRGAFVDDLGHARAGRSDDRFDGSIENDGKGGLVGLRYRGALFGVTKDADTGELVTVMLEPTAEEIERRERVRGFEQSAKDATPAAPPASVSSPVPATPAPPPATVPTNPALSAPKVATVNAPAQPAQSPAPAPVSIVVVQGPPPTPVVALVAQPALATPQVSAVTVRTIRVLR